MYSPNQPRRPDGKFGSGSSGAPAQAAPPLRNGGIHPSMRGTRHGRPVGHSGAGGFGGGQTSLGGAGPGMSGSGGTLSKGARQDIARKRQIDQQDRRGYRGGQNTYNRPSADVMHGSEQTALRQYSVPSESAQGGSSTVNVTSYNSPVANAALAVESGYGSHSGGILNLPKRSTNSEKYVR